MLKLTDFEYSLKTLANLCFDGSDKESIKLQVALGKKLLSRTDSLATLKGAMEWCKNHNIKSGSTLRGIMAVANSINKGESPLIPLDTSSSQSLIISVITRDNAGIKEFFNTRDIYTQVANYLKDRFPNLKDTPRKVFKKAFMAWGYGGSSHFKQLLGVKDEELDCIMRDMAKELNFLGIYIFRQVCLDAWSEDKIQYRWCLPDDYMVNWVITQDTFARDWKGNYVYPANKVNLELDGLKKQIDCRWAKVGTRSPKESGTRSIGANAIHSLDAYLMREMVRRCKKSFNYDSLEGIEIGELNTKDIIATNLYYAYKNTGMVSMEIMNHLSYGDTIPEDYYNAIQEVLAKLPKEGFTVRPIHDEFACLASHANEMKAQFNMLIGELYNSTMLEYFNYVFDLKAFKKGTYDKSIYSSILESDYLLA